jgi:hypothetical protein
MVLSFFAGRIERIDSTKVWGSRLERSGLQRETGEMQPGSRFDHALFLVAWNSWAPLF